MHNYFQTQAIGASKRTRTRCALIDSAIEVFASTGLEQARISTITHLAGLANGTFYNHFKDKEELAAATAAAIALEIAKAQEEAMADVERASTRIVLGSTRFMSVAMEHREWSIVLAGQYHLQPSYTEALGYLRADVERGIEQGLFAVTPDEFLLRQVGALIITALQEQLRGTSDHTVLVRRTTESILRLLGMTAKQATREVERAAAAVFKGLSSEA
jgi:AcrR family transcriptional regulator